MRKYLIASNIIIALSAYSLISLPITTLAQNSGVDYFKNEFPNIVCLEDDYLMSCFKIRKSSCIFQVKEFIDSCLDKIPKKEKPQSKHLVLGACVGTLFEKKNAALKLETPDCTNIDKWK